MTIFRFRAALVSGQQTTRGFLQRAAAIAVESLWTVPIFRQWPLSFRAFVQLRQQLWALQWRFIRH